MYASATVSVTSYSEASVAARSSQNGTTQIAPIATPPRIARTPPAIELPHTTVAPVAAASAAAYNTTATPSFAIDSASTIVRSAAGTGSRRKTEITATGSVAETIAPSTSADANESAPAPETTAAMANATNSVPGNASAAIRNAFAESARRSMLQAASKMSGGRKMNRSAGPNANGGRICQKTPAQTPKTTSRTGAGTRARSAAIEIANATPTSAANVATPWASDGSMSAS